MVQDWVKQSCPRERGRNERKQVCVRVRVRVCVRACVRVRAHVCVHVCVEQSIGMEHNQLE